jgi:hypothetical protein
MNKRNFGAVIKRIEKHPELWSQVNPPKCGTPYCFLGHAQFLRTGSDARGLRGRTTDDEDLQHWLGLNVYETELAFNSFNTLDDFKRWHKAGEVS